MRLEGTKSKVAFSILKSVSSEPNLDQYINAIKQYTVLTFTAKIKELQFRKKGAKCFKKIAFDVRISYNHCELFFFELTGLIGAWGTSVMRPIVALFVICASFFGLYVLSLPVSNALVRAVHITFLFGYTAEVGQATATTEGGSLPSIFLRDGFAAVHGLVALYFYLVAANSVIQGAIRRV